ncbi:MAG: FtsW/RodA/SpoVE family cell cycle protein [Clostridia bacterium]|nr:FtsW/RodA/SpoVE family cell cycle protein [Clostridia bacterium]
MLGRVIRFCIKRLMVLDGVLLACTTILSLMSILTLWGGSEVFGEKILPMQIAATVVGFAVMVVLANIDYRVIARRLSPYLLLGSVALLVVLLLTGKSEGTNRSWLYFSFLPFGIQPSEFIKTALAVSFGYHLSRAAGRIDRPMTLLGLLIHAGVIILLILMTGDLGVALIFLGFVAVMLFCAGLNKWYFLGSLVVAAAVLPLVWGTLEDYQRQRLLVGFSPEIDPLGYGYQPLLSRDAIMAGGFFGQGLNGGDAYEILPAAHTDFIYATACEKFGFFGGFIILAALLVLVVRVFIIAYRADCSMGGYIAAGLGACMMLQTIENVGMCLALLPVIGITLPFVSYGGSSVLAIYMMVGILHSIHAHREKPMTFYTSRRKNAQDLS